ncbi:OLC1v1034005C1 [Oldenlandia corymbosa var. corymbosa]|uniref:RING-type E3 ubiquitin transferase n=1 Tax=Oldenlandia corymbosa var. corymbosa TaxID=529605 RepID=A0AAV1CQU2_OLDCO|nr:OLC1v1034005C1 [Oldenlandia corymbosa var. corymbosa]
MEVPGADELKAAECHMTSPAAFVEGGVQDACDDSCSICLEAFCESDPSTVTTCKHEFHLQCILEWCQRSSNCPMCWQTIGLKDPTSQELLDAVEREKHFRFTPARNATIFRHPTLGDFELQHLPVGANDSELEERIIQHLAAAAAMGRARHFVHREGSRGRSSTNGRPHFLVFSSHANDSIADPASASIASPEEPDLDSTALATPSFSGSVNSSGSSGRENLSSLPNDQLSASSSRSVLMPASPPELSVANRCLVRPEPPNRDRAGPSELNSISESWKSRLNAMSIKYKETLSKSTRGWKDRFFSRSNSMADIGMEVRREVNAGIASVSRMMERLEARENIRSRPVGTSNNPSVTQPNHHDDVDHPDELPLSHTTAFPANSLSH